MTRCTAACVTPSPAQAHCAAECHLTFGSISGFDAHRKGGECTPPADLGMTATRGVWRKPMSEAERERIENIKEKPAVTTPTIELTEQQREAADKVADWYKDPDRQVFRLFGYAGTGKTSTARSIVDQLGIERVLYAAFTGKAAYVLRTKGCAASTIHSLIYVPKEKARARLNSLREELARQLDNPTDPTLVDELKREIEAEERKLDKPDWILKDPDECELSSTDLLVIDEVSMVGDRMAADLLSYGGKILVLGDPAQLPPVDGAGYFINTTPDHLLTEIHRSALDSPVTRMATAVRNAPTGDPRYGVTGPDGDSGRLDRLTLDELFGFDQVLTWRNSTRWQAIHLLRGLRGFPTGMPAPGDRIMTLANSSDTEVFNGQQFTVLAAAGHPAREDQLQLTLVDDEGTERELRTWRSGFVDQRGEEAAKREGRGSVAAATFAQAITCHKSQGSQWDNVLVIDESGALSGMTYKKATAAKAAPDVARGEAHQAGQRWLYTAVTRAAQRSVLVPSITGLIGAGR